MRKFQRRLLYLYIYLFIKNQNELSVRTSLQCTETLSVFLEDETTLFNGGTPTLKGATASTSWNQGILSKFSSGRFSKTTEAFIRGEGLRPEWSNGKTKIISILSKLCVNLLL